MCIVCLEWEKGKITSAEAMRNLGELIQSSDESKARHYYKAVEKILDKEVPMSDTDKELDTKWHEENHDD